MHQPHAPIGGSVSLVKVRCWSPGIGAAEDDAEGMPDWVSEDPETCFALAGDADGSQAEQFLLGAVGVADADVQVHPLGIRRIGPAWRNPVGGSLESKLAQPGPGTDDDPVTEVFIDAHAEDLAVEVGQCARLRAVDHRLLKASDHAQRMPDPRLPGGPAKP
jgi:hypothetical protein